LIPAAKPRVAVYIDGFNLYYGALKGTPHKWLDLDRYFRLLRPNDDLQYIRYFTAMVSGPTRPNQETYFRALGTTPLVTTILGKFKNKRVKCTLPGCSYSGNRFFQTPEEKRTDVNIAVHMLDDAHRDLCDYMLLISGDSDLVPAVRMISSRFPTKQITVYVPARDPTRGSAVELRTAAHRSRDFPLNLLPHAQFPSTMPDGVGSSIVKPAAW
jgi:hypothetical protein